MSRVCIAKYLYILIMILVFTTAVAFGQVKVVHFNAGWNEANNVEWFSKLSDADKKSLSIDDKKIQEKDYFFHSFYRWNTLGYNRFNCRIRYSIIHYRVPIKTKYSNRY